ncbi:hypothetical protein QUF74_11130 [Candidatus Halobeggiatoa sp. HSG11]|nr:hypothetical protein [Candidatus Halobeggiatoa sp. HSG11]
MSIQKILFSSKSIPFLILGFVVILWSGSGYLLYGIEKRGTFGDMFGAINALFSGLAFAGVIYAILLQRKELALQREELTLTRKELARSAQAQELSEKSLKKQANSFIISSQISAINSLIDIYSKELNIYNENIYSGKKAIEVEERKQFLLKQIDDLHKNLENLYKKLLTEEK